MLFVFDFGTTNAVCFIIWQRLNWLFMFYLNSGCRVDYFQRHRWIGFHNNISSCGCSNNNCPDCRAEWTWTDGSSTDYTNWNVYNPQNGEIYALLEVLSEWHGFASHETLKFICKKRKLHVLFLSTQMLSSASYIIV